jgi:hypothetical protein
MTESVTKGMQYKNTKPVSVAMIPDYLAKTLPAVGITFEQLDKITSVETSTLSNNENVKLLNAMFLDRVSKADLIDLKLANIMLRDHILPSKSDYSVRDRGLGMYITDELSYAAELYTSYSINDFITFYSNRDVDINAIILSEDDSYKKVFEFQVTDNTVFVILHSGFTNFLVYNSNAFKVYFLNKLMDCVFNAFGEETVYQTDLFKSFIRS